MGEHGACLHVLKPPDLCLETAIYRPPGSHDCMALQVCVLSAAAGRPLEAGRGAEVAGSAVPLPLQPRPVASVPVGWTAVLQPGAGSSTGGGRTFLLRMILYIVGWFAE